VCELPGGAWGEYRIPFVFATNGRPFLQQLRTQSGIWFCDVRRPQNLSKPMDGWYSPEGLRELLKQDLDAAEKKLDELGFCFDFALRDYQRKAIVSVEDAVKQGQQNTLLAMATGTGKTITQAANSFKDTRIAVRSKGFSPFRKR